MQRRSFAFSERHDRMLTRLSRQLGVSMVETIQRSLELLEEKEAIRAGTVSVLDEKEHQPK